MITVDEILSEYMARKSAMGLLISHMREARDHFNGDVVIPLPEMDKDEKPAVANLMSQGVDQMSMRVASVLPSLEFPPLVYGRDTGAGSEDWAHRRRQAVTGWWQHSQLKIKLRRMARWTVGYGTGPMMVRPNFEKGVPEYTLRDPLATYPSERLVYEGGQPTDTIYSYQRSFGWISSHYPDAAQEIIRRNKRTPKSSAIVDLVEWMGPEERVLLVVATRPANGSQSAELWYPRTESDWDRTGGFEVVRTPNRAGISWGVQSDRITIDRLQGHFDQTFGMFQNQARLMALETIAVEKSIFPDLAIVSTTPGRSPVLINGTWKDGRTGEINMVRDGSIQPVQLNPGFMTQPLMDRHERNIRQAGVPSQFSGEAPTGIATGRMGNQILSASVDYPIQEYQEVIATTLEEANKRAIAIAKAYFGDDKKVFHVSFNKVNGKAEYTPNTHFETDEHHVRYAAPGADVNSLVIGIGQRIGIGTMSKWTAMQQDPMIPNPEFEYQRATSERVQESLLNYVAQAVESGAMDPQDVVILWEHVESGANIAEAWKKAQEAAQERQAEEAAKAQEAAAAQAQPGAVPDPTQQPGLSPPGDPSEAGVAIQGPNPSQQNLAMLLGALRQPRSVTSPMAQPQPANRPIGG